MPGACRRLGVALCAALALGLVGVPAGCSEPVCEERTAGSPKAIASEFIAALEEGGDGCGFAQANAPFSDARIAEIRQALESAGPGDLTIEVDDSMAGVANIFVLDRDLNEITVLRASSSDSVLGGDKWSLIGDATVSESPEPTSKSGE